jgi:hypothetical protein
MAHLVNKTCLYVAIFTLFLAACSQPSYLRSQPIVIPSLTVSPIPAQSIQTPPLALTDTQAPPMLADTITAPSITNVDSKPIIATTLGNLVIESVRWVDEVNGVKPGPDEKLLLMSISKRGQPKLDPSNFSLDDFDKALRDQTKGEVHIAGDDGSYIICSMAGWVGKQYEDFAMGFWVPKTTRTLQLFWPENEPVVLHPEN